MSFFLNPALACDYYKVGHPWMQPKGMERVYSTWTARSYKHHKDYKKTVVFGQQYTIQRWLIEYFNENFFNRNLSELKDEYEQMMIGTFNPTYLRFSKFEALHSLGYLPIAIYGVPEGTLLPIGIPDHVIYNTHPDFAWLPQYLEDLWSANNWLPSTSATTAFYRRQVLLPLMEDTCENGTEKTTHMCGDFSLRGHTSIEAGCISGAGHLLSFDRTATIGANALLAKYYDADLSDPQNAPGLGTPSLEHSVVEQGIAYWKQRIIDGECPPEYMMKYLRQVAHENWEMNLIAEMCFILQLITEIQPTGVMTYVADTYDYYGVLGKVLPVIKDAILSRDGCFSIRPDSGNPVHIICGDPKAEAGTVEHMGTLRSLIHTFGSTTNKVLCEVLPPQIRMIYGDAITEEITREVGKFCFKAQIAMENLVFGIGAYTYQYVTRDTRGYAIKATNCEHQDFGEMLLYKQPKTDPGKKSPKGCVAVIRDKQGEYMLLDNLTFEESQRIAGNIYVKKFYNGEMKNKEDFYTIRDRLREEERKERDRDNF